MPGEAASEEMVAVPVSENAPWQVDAPEAVKERLPEDCFIMLLLCEAVRLDPVRGWRIWESTYNRDRDYNESSKVFRRRLEYFKRNASEVQEWNKEHSDPRMHQALNNRADVDPDWMLTPNNVGCIPYEEYIAEYELKQKEARQAPEVCGSCGSEIFVSHSKPLSGKADLQKTPAGVRSEDAAQQEAAPEAVKERLSLSDFREMLLCEAVLLDPVRGWRMWESTYKRDYDERSKVFPEKLENLQTSARTVQEWHERGERLALNDWADTKRFDEYTSDRGVGCVPIEKYITAGMG